MLMMSLYSNLSITSGSANLDINSDNTNLNSWSISSLGNHTISDGINQFLLHVV